MKKLLAITAAVFLAGSGAHAAIIFQSHTLPTLNANIQAAGQSLEWSRFDLNLGTLTAITIQITGVFSGSYSVTNLDDGEINLNSNSTGRIRLAFTGIGAPSSLASSLISPLDTTPVSTTGTSIGPESVQTFTLGSGVGINGTSLTSNQTANASYFSALGGGNFSSTVWRPVSVSAGEEGTSTIDSSTILANVTVSLTYEYTPTEAIPEPGTWAAAALLVGGAAFMRWRRRKTA